MDLQIVLDNYQNVCYPGQTLAGRVECNLAQEEHIRAIRIRFEGCARTRWTEVRGAGKARQLIEFSGGEDYFNSEYNLFGDGESFKLFAGRYVYPFAYILPSVLPSSCNLTFGIISYKIKAYVDQPSSLYSYATEFALNLLSPLDLNYLPQLRVPVRRSVDKKVRFLWFKSEPVRLDVSLPSTGFVPGQQLSALCYVQNMSNINISSVKFKVRADFQFFATCPHNCQKYSPVIICEHEDGAIGAHAEKSWTSNFTIPSMTFANLMPCHIIKSTYILEISAVLPWPYSNLTIVIPIMIGFVPLADVPTGLPGPPSEQVIPQFPAGYQLPTLLNPTALSKPLSNSDEGYQAKADNGTSNSKLGVETNKEKM